MKSSSQKSYLELGGGATPQLHPNLDLRKVDGVDIIASLEHPLPIKSDSIDELQCTYAIEHISWRKIDQFVLEISRILKPNGIATFLTANLKEQAKAIAGREWDGSESCMVFGDQDFGENAHKCGFSPESAKSLFEKAGLTTEISPHPNCPTDMVIRAVKPGNIFNSEHYWCGQLGYRPDPHNVGYRDFEINAIKADYIASKGPESVLEVGCAMGYLVGRLRRKNIDAYGVDVSGYAVGKAPTDVRGFLTVGSVDSLPFADKAIDMVVCFSTLEHIPTEKLDAAIRELRRVAEWGIVAITPGDDPHFDEDITHRTKRPLSWWRKQFPKRFEVISDNDEEWAKLKQVKLNLGSYVDTIEGWDNIDILNLPGVIQHDLTKGIPYPQNSVDLIHCSHFIEHLTIEEGKELLREIYRVLKPGGMVRISTPDLDTLIGLYSKAQLYTLCKIQPEEYQKANTHGERFSRIVFSGHKCIYTLPMLKAFLREAGFPMSRRVEHDESYSPAMEREMKSLHQEVSMFIEATKPVPPKAKKKKTLKIALLSTPFFTVPPKGYGGLEQIVADVAGGIAELGHKVTIFGPEGSAVPGCETFSIGPMVDTVGTDWLMLEYHNMLAYAEEIINGGYDIIHGNNWFGWEYSLKIDHPEL